MRNMIYTLKYDKQTKIPLPVGKNKKVVDLMKSGRGCEIITKLSTTVPKTNGCRAKKEDHEREDSEFIKTKGVKEFAYKELTSDDFDKCVHDITNTPIIKEQTSFRSINHKTYSVTSNKIAIHSPNENDKETLDKDGITTSHFRSNIIFIKCFDDKDILNSIKELKKK